MRRNHIPPYDQLEPRNGVLVIDGYGISLTVNRGHLIAQDGVGRSRRTRRFPRAGHNLNRVVITGVTGYLSLEAIDWLDRLNIGLIHLTPDQRPVLASTNLGLRNARLRRAQALAPDTPAGVELTRYLLGTKIDHQARTAAVIGHPEAIETITTDIDTAATIEELLRLEAQAAAKYWAMWEDLPIRFVTRDTARVPEHWLTFGTRSSLVGGTGPRLATNPANALLNYLYALLEAETIIACHTIGLDPQLGFFHADTPGRDSLAADIMEATRPTVDRWLLDLLADHRFTRNDFIETHRGVCRLSTTLTHRLAETTIRWAAETAPVVETIARCLASDTPTKLTSNRRRRAHGGPDHTPSTTVSLDQTCLDCGQPPTKTGDYCAKCADRRRTDTITTAVTKANRTLQKARANGTDPAHGGKAARLRGTKNRQRQLAANEWDRANERPDPAVFKTEILPVLQYVSAADIARATGLSRPYAGMIRRGAYTPHPRHWSTLHHLANANGDPSKPTQVGGDP